MSRKVIYFALIVCIGILLDYRSFAATSESANTDHHAVSFNALALAPNAGGQKAYRVEWYHHHHAFSVFDNQSLLVGSTTLKGIGYSYRLPVCDADCFWQFFSQVGGGISNAGVYGEVDWGVIIPMLPIWLPTSAPRYIPAFRIDIASQMYASRQRIITWSYPLWAGVTVSF
jgi:hypothetical protein